MQCRTNLFLQERGLRMAITSVSLFGGAFMTPVIGGKIAHDMGWRWNFYFIAIFTGAALFFVFFFVPETAYRRDHRLDIDMMGNYSQETVTASLPSSETGNDDVEKNGFRSAARGMGYSTPEKPIPEKVSYIRSLALFNGRKTDERFWKLVLRPFPLFLHPGILWACLIQGVTIGWTVFIGVIFGIMFNGPPLMYTEVKVGYMYSGAFIGSLGGLFVAGALADPGARWLAKLNNGRYEPEFRIFLVIFQLVFAGIGLFGLGYTTDKPVKYGPYPSVVFFGFVTASMVVGAVASCSYVVDAHRKSFRCDLLSTLWIIC